MKKTWRPDPVLPGREFRAQMSASNVRWVCWITLEDRSIDWCLQDFGSGKATLHRDWPELIGQVAFQTEGISMAKGGRYENPHLVEAEVT